MKRTQPVPTKRIEILKTFRDDGQTFYETEVRLVTPEKAGYYCGNGWAKDSDGEIATGEPDLSEKTLDVHLPRHRSAASNIGGVDRG